MEPAPVLLFCTPAYRGLHRLILSDRVTPGDLERRRFEDGERYLRVRSDVQGRHVAVLGGTIDDTATLELFDLAGLLVQEGCRSLTLLIPYFGYSTMERQARSGEAVTAKLRARLLSALPAPGDGLRVVLLDLHAPGLPWYFEGHIHPVHLVPYDLLAQAARELGRGEPFVVGAVDAGGAKRVQGLANRLGVEAGFVFKKRLGADRVSFTALHADVEGRPVVLCDDMVRTGGSLIQAARAYRRAGASRVAAVATHGVLPEGALDRLRDSGLLDALVVTDSHPRAVAQADGFLRVVTVAGVFERWLDHHLPTTEGP
jgi:ribose-phosphate pyrophosphokinase